MRGALPRQSLRLCSSLRTGAAVDARMVRRRGCLGASIRLLCSYLGQCDMSRRVGEGVAVNVEGRSRPEWEIEG